MDCKGSTARRAKAGKYLTFVLGREVYGVEILKVQEIMGRIDTARLPGTPACIRGIINLRTKIIPVIDLRRRFGLDAVTDTEKTCYIILQVVLSGQAATVGIAVDEVCEVLRIAEDRLDPVPHLGAGVDLEFLLGLGKVGEKVILLLDADRLLDGGDAQVLEGALLAKAS